MKFPIYYQLIAAALCASAVSAQAPLYGDPGNAELLDTFTCPGNEILRKIDVKTRDNGAISQIKLHCSDGTFSNYIGVAQGDSEAIGTEYAYPTGITNLKIYASNFINRLVVEDTDTFGGGGGSMYTIQNAGKCPLKGMAVYRRRDTDNVADQFISAISPTFACDTADIVNRDYSCKPGTFISQLKGYADGHHINQVQVICSNGDQSEPMGFATGTSFPLDATTTGYKTLTVCKDESGVAAFGADGNVPPICTSLTDDVQKDANGCPAVGVSLSYGSYFKTLTFRFSCDGSGSSSSTPTSTASSATDASTPVSSSQAATDTSTAATTTPSSSMSSSATSLSSAPAPTINPAVLDINFKVNGEVIVAAGCDVCAPGSPNIPATGVSIEVRAIAQALRQGDPTAFSKPENAYAMAIAIADAKGSNAQASAMADALVSSVGSGSKSSSAQATAIASALASTKINGASGSANAHAFASAAASAGVSTGPSGSSGSSSGSSSASNGSSGSSGSTGSSSGSSSGSGNGAAASAKASASARSDSTMSSSAPPSGSSSSASAQASSQASAKSVSVGGGGNSCEQDSCDSCDSCCCHRRKRRRRKCCHSSASESNTGSSGNAQASANASASNGNGGNSANSQTPNNQPTSRGQGSNQDTSSNGQSFNQDSGSYDEGDDKMADERMG